MDRLFIYLDSADDFDSYMVKMEDIIDEFNLNDANSVFDDTVKDDFSMEKFNFSIYFFSLCKYDFGHLLARGYSDESVLDLLKYLSFDCYKDYFLGGSKQVGKYAFKFTDNDLISHYNFEDNVYFSFFGADNVQALAGSSVEAYTIGGLNAYFETNLDISDYRKFG
jgi:hypothetical protein